jgi:lactate racemase
MRIAVEFQDQSLDFEVADDRLVGHWSGPSAGSGSDARSMALEQFEAPIDFPPISRAVVPGDRVVVPLDPTTPELTAILGALASALRTAEVESITVVSTAPEPTNLPAGVAWLVHDPDDKTGVAYLASTSTERRIYLNRQLTDADIVIPVGTLGYDATLGYRGPWSAIYPAISNRETLTRYRGLAIEDVPDREKPSSSLLESSEVSWLLGCQFQVGVLADIAGVLRVVAGLESAVRAEGAKAIDDAWTFRVVERADVVVAGVGAPGRITTFDDLASGLATASRLVRRGGKIVALTRVRDELGPALQRVSGAENPRSALNRLRGHEADPDYLAARRIAEATAWADVYLHSALDTDIVEDLALIAVDRPEEARKLASAAPSCTLLSQADRTRAIVADED